MYECWGKVCPRSFLLFFFSFFVLFSSNFLPIQAGGGQGGQACWQRQWMEEVDASRCSEPEPG